MHVLTEKCVPLPVMGTDGPAATPCDAAPAAVKNNSISPDDFDIIERSNAFTQS
jgi:hypothetical protein